MLLKQNIHKKVMTLNLLYLPPQDYSVTIIADT